MPFFTNPLVRQEIANVIAPGAPALPAGAPPIADLVTDPYIDLPRQLGDTMGKAIENRKTLAPLGDALATLQQSPGYRSLAGAALLGGGLGAGAGFLAHKDPVVTGLAGAGLASLLGLGARSLMRRHRSQAAQDYETSLNPVRTPTLEQLKAKENQELKRAATYVDSNEDPLMYIRGRLLTEGSLDAAQKARYIQQLNLLSPFQLDALAQALRAVVGGGVGYLVARFLLGAGSFGRLLGAGVGAMIGGGMSGLPTNSFGQSVDVQRDFFGRPRTI